MIILAIVPSSFGKGFFTKVNKDYHENNALISYQISLLLFVQNNS
jgi:hypothetical protein